MPDTQALASTPEAFSRSMMYRQTSYVSHPDENGIASLVAQGFGIALVADVDAIHRDDICIRHLVSHESFSHTVYMGYMTGKYQLPAIKRFIEFVRESCS